MSLTNPDKQKCTLLIVDDDTLFGDSVRHLFDDENTVVTTANTVGAARILCSQNAYDVVLLDNNLPDGSGLELMPDILNLNDHAKIILVTAFPTFDSAVKAIKNGAYDYISKPVDMEELQTTVERAFQASRLEAVEQVARYQNDKQRREAVLVGFKNPQFGIADLIMRAAASTAPVLITGETGTGKNVIAKLIHHSGHSVTSPIININCAALPETLIESELFGVEKGAFTGATQTRKGLFELADGGSLFLDEIGEMPATLQAKMLTALEDRSIRRVGGDKDRAINVRIIAATNAEPEKAIESGRFRKDLFYRLSVIRIHLPPLRERLEDLPDLCAHFIEHFAPNRRVAIPDYEMERLQSYHFPGNVRELRNIIERCLILHEGTEIYPSQIVDLHSPPVPAITTNGSMNGHSGDVVKDALSKGMTLPELERQYILAVYERNRNNIARASNDLGISFSTMKRKLQSFGVR
ncbi:MAG: sigma-54 dependent transcriptional regulator [Pyrinomonadaceae bacterium]|nr:sigma-54 dependent transcriptional regulator [Pyrinomonadaceae bacterium]